MLNYKIVPLFEDFYFSFARKYAALDDELGIILLDLLR
jgi:hypothetical protein